MANAHAIPVFDFSPFRDGSEAGRRSMAEKIGWAAETYGFMTLANHGVAPEVVNATLQIAETFFKLPDETKLLIQEKRTNRGFQPMFDNVDKEGKPSGQEAFSMGHPVPPDDPALLDLPFYAATPFPDLPGFKAQLETAYGAMFEVGRNVLRAMALHLGKSPDFFDNALVSTYSNMRVIHYPPAEAVAHRTDVGVRPHEDQGLITLLIQDSNGGLEVRGPDGTWLPVYPDPEAIVVNVGKLLTRWTNGRYKSALHQVINRSGRERYSMPLFMHPSFHQKIDPADFARPGEELHFEPIVAGEQVYANFSRQRQSWKAA
jgi:isopenicillin N synthase-like dioxygenase